MKDQVASLFQIITLLILFDLLVFPVILPPVEMQSCPSVQPLEPAHSSWYCWPSDAQVRYFFTSAPGARTFTENEKPSIGKRLLSGTRIVSQAIIVRVYSFPRMLVPIILKYVKYLILHPGLRLIQEVQAALRAIT